MVNELHFVLLQNGQAKKEKEERRLYVFMPIYFQVILKETEGKYSLD